VTISEVSKKYDLSPDTLRYYERIGLIPRVDRDRRGNRDYSEGDCNWIQFIKCMRSAGLPIETLTEYVSLFQQGAGTRLKRKGILLKQRERLLEQMEVLQNSIGILDRKISNYDKVLFPHEKELTAASRKDEDELGA